MSYCVNCGVELHGSCSACPLCNTKVYHPKEGAIPVPPPPFPVRKGNTDPVRRTDVALLISVVLAVTAGVCGLLNLFVFQSSHWSLYVIGGCILLWVLFLPVFWDKMNAYLSILLDGIGIAGYFKMIAWLHPAGGWYAALALPIVALITGLILLLAVCIRQIHVSVLSVSVLVLAEMAVFTVAAELLINRFLQTSMGITWSAIVLTCCVIIDAALLTIIRRSRLREEVRRRMHI